VITLPLPYITESLLAALLAGLAAARRTTAAIDGARLVLLPGVGHDLPAAVWPQVASEVRALADRAAVRTGG